MTPTRIRTLLGTAVVFAALSWLLLSRVYATLPLAPWTVLPAVLIAGRRGGLSRLRTARPDSPPARDPACRSHVRRESGRTG